ARPHPRGDRPTPATAAPDGPPDPPVPATTADPAASRLPRPVDGRSGAEPLPALLSATPDLVPAQPDAGWPEHDVPTQRGSYRGAARRPASWPGPDPAWPPGLTAPPPSGRHAPASLRSRCGSTGRYYTVPPPDPLVAITAAHGWPLHRRAPAPVLA